MRIFDEENDREHYEVHMDMDRIVSRIVVRMHTRPVNNHEEDFEVQSNEIVEISYGMIDHIEQLW